MNETQAVTAVEAHWREIQQAGSAQPGMDPVTSQGDYFIIARSARFGLPDSTEAHRHHTLTPNHPKQDPRATDQLTVKVWKTIDHCTLGTLRSPKCICE